MAVRDHQDGTGHEPDDDGLDIQQRLPGEARVIEEQDSRGRRHGGDDGRPLGRPAPVDGRHRRYEETGGEDRVGHQCDVEHAGRDQSEGRAHCPSLSRLLSAGAADDYGPGLPLPAGSVVQLLVLHIREYLQKELKYSVCDIIFNTCDYTKIPQNRDRTFLICFKDEPLWEHPDIFNDINTLKSIAPLTSLFYENLPNRNAMTDPKANFLSEEINDNDLYSKDHFPEYFKMLQKTYLKANKNENYNKE